MKRIWHKTLNQSKWDKYSIDRQILMIATEFARAKSFISKNDFKETKNCYERAFELLDLCKNDSKWLEKLKELTRFREYLGNLYLTPKPNLLINNQMFKILLFWNSSTSLVKI